MSSLPPWMKDLILSAAPISIAAVAIGLFMRATRDKKEPPSQEKPIPEVVSSISSLKTLPGTSLKSSDVERARKELRLLALERDALSLVISKFFEAEDEGEITREERIRLSKEYEARMKSLSDKMRRAELIVGLYELERIREELVKMFDAKLSETNAKIEELRRELKLAPPIEEEKKPPAKRVEKKKAEEKPRRRKPKGSEIDEKIEKLRQEVLKELEELEKLEIEI